MYKKPIKQVEYYLFETALGICGIAWKIRDNSRAAPVITSFQLPEATVAQTEQSIAERSGGRRTQQIPASIARTIVKIQKHLQGDLQDFQSVAIDLNGLPPFTKQVYERTRSISSGQTTTYGVLAQEINHPAAARAVGQALGKNPIPLIIPCHRVLASNNKVGGFSAHGGVSTKARLLAIEGITPGRPAIIKSKRDLLRIASLLREKDLNLAECLKKPIEFHLRSGQSPYETLIEAVIHQQLSPKAAVTILGRVMDIFQGSKMPDPLELLKTGDEQLRNAGLSRAKIKAIKDIAQKMLDGIVPSSKEIVTLSDEEIIRRLTSIHGVGLWTVQMMLIFNLGRVDVFPAEDYALRKSISEVFGMEKVPSPKQVAILSAVWRPYRTVASLYLWNAIST